MAYVPVPKDLTKVKTKVMFNLTRRQLVCFTAGALVGVPLFLWLREPAGNSYFEDVADDLFQGLSMLFIHCQQEEGHHDQHHTHGGHAVSRRLTEQKEQRYAYKRPGGKADQLPLGQIEHDLCFDFS